MITYKIDKSAVSKANSQLKDLQTVLSEISPSLQILQNIFDEHESALSTPVIDEYRSKIQSLNATAITLTKKIADQTSQLCSVSEQAAKHLVSVDEHFGSALQYQRETTKTETREPVSVRSESRELVNAR